MIYINMRWKEGEEMALNQNEKSSLEEMLSFCKERYGAFSYEDAAVYENGCTQCSGSCHGHGISVWTACDVK